MAWIHNQTLKSHSKALELFPSKPSAKNDVLLSFYDDTPNEEVSIQEFETFALDRLRVLKGAELAKSQGKKDAELDNVIKQLCQKHLKAADVHATHLKDRISHFILRLAFCRTEDNRKWLLAQECELFKHRFKNQSLDEQVTDDEQLQFAAQLDLVCRSAYNASLAALRQQAKGGRVDFFKVPFEQVPDLVATRRVFLHRGTAFVPKELLSSVLTASFRQRLSRSLVLCAGRCAVAADALEADRLAPIIASLSTRHITQDIQGASAGAHLAGERVTLAQLPGLAQRHFPLCMQNLYHNLMSDHHLRHAGRQQLGLFLKRVGLSLDEAMVFFKHAMAQKTPGEKFEKEYAYNVRHMYGKEGRRKDYEPHSCMKVIASVPGVGEFHGCPFKTMPEPNLRAALTRMAVPAELANEAVEKANGQHYQVACSRVFEGLFGEAPDAGVTHPNTYFAEGLALVRARQDALGQAAEAAAPAAAGAAHTPPPAAGSATPLTPALGGATPLSGTSLTPASGSTAGGAAWLRTPLVPTPTTQHAGGAADPGGRTPATPSTGFFKSPAALTPPTLAMPSNRPASGGTPGDEGKKEGDPV